MEGGGGSHEPLLPADVEESSGAHQEEPSAWREDTREEAGEEEGELVSASAEGEAGSLSCVEGESREGGGEGAKEEAKEEAKGREGGQQDARSALQLARQRDRAGKEQLAREKEEREREKAEEAAEREEFERQVCYCATFHC